VNMLLIGSGDGNLRVPVALDALLRGLVEALAEGAGGGSIRRIRIVERDWKRAQMIARAFQQLKATGDDAHAGLDIRPEVVAGSGGAIGRDVALSAVLVALAKAGKGGYGPARRKAVPALLQGIPAAYGLRAACEEALGAIGTNEATAIIDVVEQLNFGRMRPRLARSGDDNADVPARVSFISSETGVRAAAITETAVVPERFVSFDWKLMDELIARMSDPEDVATIPDLSALLTGFVIPRDFREELSHSDTLIFEVDRDTARIHWEMLGTRADDYAAEKPVALNDCVARQLRTSYSPPPSRPATPAGPLRALVIGDPGDPDKGYDLPGARREAISVAQLLAARGVQVDALIASPKATRDGDLRKYEPATALEVLRLLRNHRYDLMHYAGHGDFDPDDPEHRAGWIFGERFFTSRELGGIDSVPALVVANACLSALTSRKHGSARSQRSSADDALLPGLVDEFFMRGVRNYVGTAWEVNDEGAVLFAKTLYGALIPGGNGTAPETLGRALLRARQALKQQDALYGALWAAYQHYGDPAFHYVPLDARMVN